MACSTTPASAARWWTRCAAGVACPAAGRDWLSQRDFWARRYERPGRLAGGALRPAAGRRGPGTVGSWTHLIALPLGFLLDQLLGDPPGWPHPVRWIGRLIQLLEPPLRGCFPERLGGIVLLLLVIGRSRAG